MKRSNTWRLFTLLIVLVFFVSCDSKKDVQWTIHVRQRSPGGQPVSQKLIWDPIRNELVGQENEMSRIKGREEMKEAGYRIQPTGYLLSERTKVYYSKDAVQQIFTFNFDGDFSDSPEGEVITQTWINGEPQNLYSGDFFVTTGLKDQGVREYLAENSQSFLFSEVYYDIKENDLDSASRRLEKIIELDSDHIAGWRTKTWLHIARDEAEAALQTVNTIIKEDSSNLAAMEQLYTLHLAQGNYERAYEFREKLLKEQIEREEALVIASYSDKKPDRYYLEEYYSLEGYMDLLELALLIGDTETAKKNLDRAEKDLVENGVNYSVIYDESARSFEVPYYRSSKVYELVKKLNAYQILFNEREGNTEARDEYFFFLDGLIISDFGSTGLRPTELTESMWLPDSISRNEMIPGSEWEIGRMISRPEEFLIELAGEKRHPETIMAVSELLPMVAHLDDPSWDFSREWLSGLHERIDSLDDRFVPLIKRISGYGEGEKSEVFDKQLRESNSDFFKKNILEDDHFIRGYSFDDNLDITLHGDEFFAMNEFYIRALLVSGKAEEALDFGLDEHLGSALIFQIVSDLTRDDAVSWDSIRHDLEGYISERYNSFSLFLLRQFINNPAYEDARDRLWKAYSILQMYANAL